MLSNKTLKRFKKFISRINGDDLLYLLTVFDVCSIGRKPFYTRFLYEIVVKEVSKRNLFNT